MSVSTAQYVDLLFKKLQGVAKTANATVKGASNESIASPAFLRGDIVWTQADQIPGTAQVVSGITQGYLTTGRIECTADTTVPPIGGIYPTWLTNLQYWIPQEFGSTWPVKVWVDTAGAANPTVTGTQIFAPGIGGVGEFFFDTQAGLLNFIGETIPSTLTAGKSIFITGYRYVGLLGVTNLPSANIGNIQITGNTIVTLNTNGDLVFDPNGSGNVRILANTSVTGNITASGFVSATGNITGNYFIGNGSQLTGVAASSVNANALIGNTLSSNVLYSSLTQVGTLSNVSVSGNVVGGNVLTSGVVSATGSITSAANIVGGNVTTAGLITATGNIQGGNVLTAGVVSATSNVTGGNLLTGGAISATGNVQANVFIGNGSGLTNITGANVSGQVANALVAGTVYTNAQPNITSVGTLTSASVSGNITGGNVLTSGIVSATGNVTSSGVITTGPSGNITGANVISATTFTATANITGGNILTVGKISTSGNVYGNAILSDNYFYANGQPIPTGIIYTAAVSPPVGPDIGDQWYNTTSDVLYEYINDGTSSYWVDTTSPAFAGGVVANVAISGTLAPVANVSFDIGTSNVYFRNTYTQNLYTNNRLPAYNMPLGATVQTVMSSSLGGSITNSTTYADISYATVTIVPSSATSKILILATGTSDFSAVVGFGITADTQLVRSPSASLQMQTVGTSGTGGVGATGAIAYSYMDAPGTTSAVTYKLQQRVSNSSSTLTSTNIWLIAMEIAAS
jgi:hypothetical protein